MPAFRYQFLQNIAFILFITKLALVMIKQKINTIITNLYFKLLANNINLSTSDKFFLEKINSNIKVNASFLQFLIIEVTNIRNINITNYEINISAITISVANNEKNYYVQNS